MRLCCIFNYAPHYRLPIYQKIAEAFKAHFYFGNRLRNSEKIEKLDYKELPGFKKEFRVTFMTLPVFSEWACYWIRLALSKEYNKYLITPNIGALNQWIFLILCFLLRKKIYTWEHGLLNRDLKKSLLLRYRLFHKFTTAIFVYGDKAKDNMIQLGYNKRKIHTIYNSLNYDSALRIRHTLKGTDIYYNYFNNRNPTLLFIGRLTQVKKLHIIFEVDRILQKSGLNINYIFIGDGPERNRLELLANKTTKDHKRYWFYGKLYDEKKIAELLYNATICVSPGNVGLTAIHSLSYGLPVITHNNFTAQMPEHEAIKEGETGSFFKENDVEDMAMCIKSWLISTKETRETIRQNCYAMIDTKFNSYNQIKILKETIGL